MLLWMMASNIIFVYYYCLLDARFGSLDYELEHEKELLHTSAESVRFFNPLCEVWIITNQLFSEYLLSTGDYNQVIVNSEVSSENLDYQRVKSQLDIVQRLLNHGSKANIVFLDHDTLVSCDLSFLFNARFDYAVTCNFSNKYLFDSNWLPLDSEVATVNAGVQLCKATEEAMLMLNLKLQKCSWINDNLSSLPVSYGDNPLRWGCDQMSMMLLFNKAIYSDFQDSVDIASSHVKFFSCLVLNYSPQLGLSVKVTEFYEHFIWHFKGQRRTSMIDYWNLVRKRLIS